ncbi:fimbria/pilus outer membrane usher protein [Dyella japonica]|uniref:Fimbrial protein n=1 Tax=Dyella japonica A8 TaxID=1217721 RepID=A0A075K0W0_9GAMM|nr:fimbria/pilus outer membrane usher protein [Dyella japonica]AIF45893.1 hypothetical protein HY57_00740 [Dyella japonica A8]
MTALHATTQRRTSWSVACRRAFLSSAIAATLAGATFSAHALPAAANGADPAASGGYADFDRSMLSGAGQNTTDLSRFEHGNPVLPGEYVSDVYLNNVWMSREAVRFAAPSAKADAVACLSRKMLDQFGLHPKMGDDVAKRLDDPNGCVSLGELIPDATMIFDMTRLRLDVSVPQAYLGVMPRGYVSPEYWDAGTTAGLLNYNFNSFHSSSQGASQTSSYLGVSTGLNVGLWHLREQGTMTWTSGSGNVRSQSHWQNIQTYLQRDLPSLRAVLSVGDSYTDGAVFDSYGIRGVQLSTDDRMLPQTMQGYAPMIRGVATTNALVSVRQNGVQIYQTTVSPGPFVINDLYPTGFGGNLDVTVTEADGHTTSFVVPYASVAQLLRPGITRFDVAAGQLRAAAIKDQPGVVQATVQHGFNNLLTGYAGIVGSQGYGAALIGAAIDTHYGALALDVTQAQAHIPGYSTQSGQSVRVTYSKIIPSTQTNFSVAAYRYSTGGYLSLTDAEQARDYVRQGRDAFATSVTPVVPTIDGVNASSVLTPAQQAALNGTTLNAGSLFTVTGVQRQRSSFTLSMSQPLGPIGGSLYANVSVRSYWNRNGNDTQYQVGYNNHFRRLAYGVSATRSVDSTGHYDNQFFVNFTLPLGSTPHSPTMTLNLSHDDQSGSQEQAMVSGTLGSDNQYNYGATASHSSGGSGSSSNAGSLSAGYRSPYAVFSATYGKGSGYSQASVSVSGSIIAHPGGVTFGQPISDTVGVVYAPGAAGARVNSSGGIVIDRFGYAIVPYLTPYSLNTVQIDPKGLPLDVQLSTTSAQVAPYAGAVVMLKFKTENGRTILIHSQMENGDAPPFGAEVFNEKNASLGVVGQAGQILVRGVEQSGQLTVRWNDDDGQAQSCSFSYQLPAKDKNTPSKAPQQIQATCVRPTMVAQATRSGS